MATTIESLANELLSIYDLDGKNDYANTVEMLKDKGFKTSKQNIWKIINKAKTLVEGELEELDFE
jgi:Ca2+-binding EF-hand superfamily protein